MSFTLDNAVAEARRICQDSEKERYTDEHFVTALNLALADVRRLRPDIVSMQSAPTGFPYSAANLGQNLEIPVSFQYYTPIVAFMAGWVELMDDEFAAEGRTVALLSRFTSQLVVGG